jgi:hypothetical protein
MAAGEGRINFFLGLGHGDLGRDVQLGASGGDARLLEISAHHHGL